MLYFKFSKNKIESKLDSELQKKNFEPYFSQIIQF